MQIKELQTDTNKKQTLQTGGFAMFQSGCYAVDVAGEHRAFLDIGDAEEASGDALEADGEATVRGHAVSLPSALCPLSRAPQARIPRTPHGAHRTP